MKNFGKGIGGAFLSLAFVFGIITAIGSSTQAQTVYQHAAMIVMNVAAAQSRRSLRPES